MMGCGSLEYAQARMQARHGQRADETTWQRLETAREFAALLDAARQSPLRAWVAGLTAHSGAREIEALLRGHWRALVAEVAGWMPGAWQPAITWCHWLPLLPALQHLARGGAAPGWMAEDPLLRTVATATPEARATALAAGGDATLAAAWATPDRLGAAWLQGWWQRLPRRAATDSLRRVLALLQAHHTAFAAAPPGSGTLLRQALRARLAPWLHRAAAEPAAALVYLALGALDLERLRGELLRRALFPAVAEAA